MKLRAFLRYLPYVAISLAVMAPLLLPGFVLSMDMVFTPQIRMPHQVDNTFLFYTLLHVLNVVLPADLIEKALLFAILLLSGVGMDRFLRTEAPKVGRVATYIAGGFYMVNPFTYDRFMAGQYGVLLGYALLPWFCRSLLSFVRAPSARGGLAVASWVTAMSIVSIHSLGYVVVLGLALAGIAGRDRAGWKAIATHGMLAAVAFILASSYWLPPTMLGHGKIADSLSTFGPSERHAFTTIDANGTGPLGSVLGLQGFWQENRGIFVVPIDAMGGWGALQLLVWALVICGVVVAWRQQQGRAIYMSAIVAVAAVIASGFGGDWLAQHIPFFAGYREPQKFVAVVAFALAYFMALAVWRLSGMGRRQWIVAGMIVALLVAYTPTMWWGFGGQLQPTNYPRGWYDINQQLGSAERQRVLFLPWHLYMSYGFASGRIIASPASAFFDAPIIAGDNPDLAGVWPQTVDATKATIEQSILPRLERGEPVAAELTRLHIGYILLAKEYDYRNYDALDRQPDVRLVRDTPTLRLYRVVAR